jgi:hypothetical protein
MGDPGCLSLFAGQDHRLLAERIGHMKKLGRVKAVFSHF